MNMPAVSTLKVYQRLRDIAACVTVIVLKMDFSSTSIKGVVQKTFPRSQGAPHNKVDEEHLCAACTECWRWVEDEYKACSHIWLLMNVQACTVWPLLGYLRANTGMFEPLYLTSITVGWWWVASLVEVFRKVCWLLAPIWMSVVSQKTACGCPTLHLVIW